jgi:hypothetical protein
MENVPEELRFDRYQFDCRIKRNVGNAKKLLKRVGEGDYGRFGRIKRKTCSELHHDLPWWWSDRQTFEKVFRRRAAHTKDSEATFMKWLQVAHGTWVLHATAKGIADLTYGDLTQEAVKQILKRLRAVPEAELTEILNPPAGSNEEEHEKLAAKN